MRVRIPSPALLLVAAVGSGLGLATTALGDGAERSPGPAMSRQAPPGPAPPADDDNPCTGPESAGLRCPDLIMTRPFGLRIERSPKGRQLLRAGNSIDSVGVGPAVLRGVRTSRRFMRASQLIQRADGGTRRIAPRGRLEFKQAHLGRRYWKFHDAARFELWALDAAGTKTHVVRTGPKVSYCLRDLEHTRPSLPGSPRRVVHPACSTSPDRRRVTLGTSVGWSDVYPPTYPEQWIDVTGLRGCFAYVHTADPGNALHESDEGNNVSQVVVRLPFRRSAPRGSCPGRQFGVRHRQVGGTTGAW